MFNSRINNKFGNYKPNKNWFKTIDVDRNKLYSVVILTNSPDMVDYSECDRVYELLVDKGNIFNKLIKKEDWSFGSPRFVTNSFLDKNRKIEALLKDIKNNMNIEQHLSCSSQSVMVRVHDKYLIDYLREEINKLIK